MKFTFSQHLKPRLWPTGQETMCKKSVLILVMDSSIHSIEAVAQSEDAKAAVRQSDTKDRKEEVRANEVLILMHGPLRVETGAFCDMAHGSIEPHLSACN